ncbi:MAG: APC family permease [Chloroflexota bacterium]|nr:APC family permease [Chloroflexota bacterium]
MTNPDRDAGDQETSAASSSTQTSPDGEKPLKRRPTIRNDAKLAAAASQRAEGAPKVRVPRSDTPVVTDLSGQQPVQGVRTGDRYIRIVRQQSDDFERAGPGHLVATEESMEPEGTIARGYQKIKRVLIGRPLTSASGAHERLTKVKALAVLSSDALSSVAYATEEILRVLLVAGGLAVLDVSLPIAGAIVLLLIIVGTSYRQTIKAYPHGGGSYIVAKDNLGEIPALAAGAALLVAYLLTVAVSIAASVAALVSAFPSLSTHRVGLGILFIVLVTVLNLRGIRESGSIFSVPTYLFLGGMFTMIGVGMVRAAMDGFEAQPVPHEANELAGAGALSAFVVLRAFSSGCAAMTGVEAISDGVPAFKPPEWKNARTTLTVMIAILAVTFSGITYLAHHFGAFPMDAEERGYETVVSQIARNAFGGTNAGYYYIQFATMAILVLGANTAYSDFPRLSFFLARDRYMPRQFTFRGDRLAFSTGILTLGLLAAIVLAIYGGEVEALIPLYAVGVFASFTISQFAMFTRWQKRREPGWQVGRVVNLTGATATAVVTAIVLVSKFREGAWLTGIVIAVLLLAMRAIHKHYQTATRELATSTPLDPDQIVHTVLVPVASLNRVAKQTLAYARSISNNVTAVHVSDEDEDLEEFRAAWTQLGLPINLVIIESPYRQLVGPLLRYIDEIDKQRPNDTLTVVLPEFIARHWWEHLLHNQTALRLKAALLFRPGTVVTSVPYHLERT